MSREQQSRQGIEEKIRTPRRREVERVVDQLVVDEAPVPRVDRPVRALAQVALRGSGHERPVAVPIALALAERLRLDGEPREGLPEELPLVAEVLDEEWGRGVARVDDLQRREVPVLRVREVEVVPAQVLSGVRGGFRDES